MVNRFLEGYKYRCKQFKQDMLVMSVRKTDPTHVYMIVIWMDRATCKSDKKIEQIQISRKDMRNWSIAS